MESGLQELKFSRYNQKVELSGNSDNELQF